MKIQFKKDTWVVQSYGGGFDGGMCNKAIEVKAMTPFEIINYGPGGKRYSDIIVFIEDGMDGDREYILNVPNELFEEII